MKVIDRETTRMISIDIDESVRSFSCHHFVHFSIFCLFVHFHSIYFVFSALFTFFQIYFDIFYAFLDFFLKLYSYGGYTEIEFENFDNKRVPERRDVFALKKENVEKLKWPSTNLKEKTCELHDHLFELTGEDLNFEFCHF